MRSFGLALALLWISGCSNDGDPAGPRDGPLPFDAAVITGDRDTGPPSDAGEPDGGLTNGCVRLREPQAMPGDPIDGDDWTTFAQPFFATYCTRCHSTTLVGMVDRNGAPDGRNWDDEATVRMFLMQMRLWVGELNAMPIGDPQPTCEERQRLVRWIDADAP